MDKNLKKWIETWKKAGPALEAAKRAELQDEDYYEKNRELLFDMLQYAAEHRTERKTSEFVIMQKRFKEQKRKNPSL